MATAKDINNFKNKKEDAGVNLVELFEAAKDVGVSPELIEKNSTYFYDDFYGKVYL